MKHKDIKTVKSESLEALFKRVVVIKSEIAHGQLEQVTAGKKNTNIRAGKKRELAILLTTIRERNLKEAVAQV